MTAGERETVLQLGFIASRISALCSVVATSLHRSPNTASQGEAVEGVQMLAEQLTSALLAVGDPEQ